MENAIALLSEKQINKLFMALLMGGHISPQMSKTTVTRLLNAAAEHLVDAQLLKVDQAVRGLTAPAKKPVARKAP